MTVRKNVLRVPSELYQAINAPKIIALSIFLAIFPLAHAPDGCAQELSQETIDRLVRFYLPRDLSLNEVLEETKVSLDDYSEQSELIDVIRGRYWDDEHEFMFVAHDDSNPQFTNQWLRLTFFPARSRNLNHIITTYDRKTKEVDFDLKCITTKSCRVGEFNKLLWEFLLLALGPGDRDIYKKAYSGQMEMDVDYDQVYLYTYQIKECPPEGGCMRNFDVFVEKGGKVLGSSLSNVGYRYPW